MEILPIDSIKDDLEAMALLRMELFQWHQTVDQQLIELNLCMLRAMGTTGQEYELSRRAAKAMSMRSTAQEKIRKDGMIGQLELKSGIVETLEKEQYHEKELPEPDSETNKASKEAKEKQKEQSVLFIANQMGAKMRQISLSEEDFYYEMKELLKLWREQIRLLQEMQQEDGMEAYDHEMTLPESLTPDELEENIEKLSTMTESYLAGYLKVMNTIKNVVLKNHLLIVIHSNPQ